MKKGMAGAVILGMLLLILDSGRALRGASEGIRLCLCSVLPALLPFWVLSSLLTRLLWGSGGRVSRFLGRLFSIPVGAESLLIPAFLGGYPAGAGCIGAAYREGRLGKKDAQRLLGYCSNVGPAFLFGIVAPQLKSFWAGWYLWLLQILGAWTASRLLPGRCKTTAAVKNSHQGDLLGDAAAAMGKICVSVILFRVLLEFLEGILPGNPLLKTVVGGLLELTNGCCTLGTLTPEWRLPVAAGLMSLGGLCVGLQTASVTKGLELGLYAWGKGISCLVSVAGAVCPWSLPGILLLPFLKKWVAFFRKPVYNGRNQGNGRTLCYSEKK